MGCRAINTGVFGRWALDTNRDAVVGMDCHGIAD